MSKRKQLIILTGILAVATIALYLQYRFDKAIQQELLQPLQSDLVKDPAFEPKPEDLKPRMPMPNPKRPAKDPKETFLPDVLSHRVSPQLWDHLSSVEMNRSGKRRFYMIKLDGRRVKNVDLVLNDDKIESLWPKALSNDSTPPSFPNYSSAAALQTIEAQIMNEASCKILSNIIKEEVWDSLDNTILVPTLLVEVTFECLPRKRRQTQTWMLGAKDLAFRGKLPSARH